MASTAAAQSKKLLKRIQFDETLQDGEWTVRMVVVVSSLWPWGDGSECRQAISPAAAALAQARQELVPAQQRNARCRGRRVCSATLQAAPS